MLSALTSYFIAALWDLNDWRVVSLWMISNWESIEKEMEVQYWKAHSDYKNGEVIELILWEDWGASIADYSNLYKKLHR